MTGGAFPIAGLVRQVRRAADLSQRQLARCLKVAPSTIGKIEAGTLTPSVDLFQRLLAVAGHYLVVVDRRGRMVRPMADWDDTRDGAERRYPAHLDTILDPRPGEWWADVYGLCRPPETFYRDRLRRDQQRARSQWEVRVAKYRGVPRPPLPGDGDWFSD